MLDREKEIHRVLMFSCQLSQKQLENIGTKFYKSGDPKDVMLGNAIIRLAWMEKQERELCKLLRDIKIEVGEGDGISKLRKYIRCLQKKKRPIPKPSTAAKGKMKKSKFLGVKKCTRKEQEQCKKQGGYGWCDTCPYPETGSKYEGDE